MTSNPLARGLCHVAIAVPDLEATAARFAGVFGIAVSTPLVNEAQGVRLAYLELGNARIELIEPLDERSTIARFLEKNPRGGLHHVCLAVDDVAEAVKRIEAAGGEVPGGLSTNAHGDAIAFVHPRSTGGVLVEIEAGHPADQA